MSHACDLRLQLDAEVIALDRPHPQEMRAAGVVAAFAAADPSKAYPDVVPERVLASVSHIVSAALR